MTPKERLNKIGKMLVHPVIGKMEREALKKEIAEFAQSLFVCHASNCKYCKMFNEKENTCIVNELFKHKITY